ncbi:MAG: ATP-binding cassette domain-containing protein [Alphaproteobacteria bacterium]|nr:ATP-binding cassette domain-containing protein [Alphaproteobacteria bacterium]
MGLTDAKEQILSDHIKIRGLSIRTPQGELLLESADIDFRPGEITLLVGPSASGKSSLALALCGLLSPNQWGITGTVATADHNMDLQMENDGVGVLVFQTGSLLDTLSASENIGLAQTYSRKPAPLPVSALDLVAGISPKVMPEVASGGMRQRIAILRALVNGRDLIVLDEPNAGLDPVNAHLFCKMLQETCRTTGRSALIVAHHTDGLVELADQVLVLNPDEKRLRSVPCTREAIHNALQAQPAGASTDFREDWKHALGKNWKLRWIVKAAGENLSSLVFSPLLMGFVAIGAAIAGIVGTFFSFNYQSLARFLIPLLHDEALAGLGLIQLSVVTPLITSLLVVSRNNALISADIAWRVRSSQILAMRNLGAPLTLLVTAPMILCSMLSFLVSGALATAVVSYASIQTWGLMFSDQPLDLWRQSYFASVGSATHFPIVIGFAILKFLLCGMVSSAIATGISLKSQSLRLRMTDTITLSVVLGAIMVLLIHGALSIIADSMYTAALG